MLSAVFTINDLNKNQGIKKPPAMLTVIFDSGYYEDNVFCFRKSDFN